MSIFNKGILGIDIGGCSLKLALCNGRSIVQLAEEPMPDQMVRDGRVVSPEAMANFLKETVRKNRISAHNCAVVLPSSQVFVRQTVLPVMTEEHLKLNLPFEFRDFIPDDRDKYFYDYFVIDTENGEDGEPAKLHLMAAAARKELISQYNDMCRWAGLRLKTAIPAEAALVNLLRRNAQQAGGAPEQPQCIIDLGHTGTRIYFYDGDRFDAVRSAERGGLAVDEALAASMNIDIHIARAHKENGADGELDRPEAAEVMREISTEVLRAVNFYSYNNRDKELTHGWLCGGGGRVQQLREEMQTTLGFPLRPASELIQGSPDERMTGVCYAAIGAAMQ